MDRGPFQEPVCRTPPRSRLIKLITRMIENTHYVVLIAVLAVLAISMTIFVFGAIESAIKIRNLIQHAELKSHVLTISLVVEFLEIISDMLKAVIFYLVGMAFYSLFIQPLSICMTLGVKSLRDLEAQLINVIVVILAVEFLEHFILWEEPDKVLKFAISLGLVVSALVFFRYFSLRKDH